MKHFNVFRRPTFLLGAFGVVTALALITLAVLLHQSLATSFKVAASVVAEVASASMEQSQGIASLVKR